MTRRLGQDRAAERVGERGGADVARHGGRLGRHLHQAARQAEAPEPRDQAGLERRRHRHRGAEDGRGRLAQPVGREHRPHHAGGAVERRRLAVERARAAHQRGAQRLGGRPRRHQRHRPGRRLHGRRAGADRGGGRQRRQAPRAPAPAPPPAARSPRRPAPPGSPEAPATGGRRRPRRRSRPRPASAASARASSIQRASDAPGAGPTISVGTNSTPASCAGARHRLHRLGVVERVGRRAPGARRCRRRRARTGARRRARAARSPHRLRDAHDDPHRGAAGLAQDRPQAVPGALGARLERRPRAARVERLEHARAHLGQRRGRDGEVVGAPRPCPMGTGRGRAGSRQRSRRRRAEASRISLRWCARPGYPARVTRGRRTRACACRSAAGRPRSRTAARRPSRRSRARPAWSRSRPCRPSRRGRCATTSSSTKVGRSMRIGASRTNSTCTSVFGRQQVVVVDARRRARASARRWRCPSGAGRRRRGRGTASCGSRS